MAQNYDLTAVGVNPAKDRAHRMRVYFITMTIRVLCVASLFFVRGWWVLLVGLGAVVLPYVAVLIANQAAHGGGASPEAPTPLGIAPPPAEPAETDGETTAARALLVVDAQGERRASGTGQAAGTRQDETEDPRP